MDRRETRKTDATLARLAWCAFRVSGTWVLRALRRCGCVRRVAALADETSPPVRASSSSSLPILRRPRALISASSGLRAHQDRGHTEPRHVRVSIAPTGDELSVAITFQQPSGRRALRTLRARTCDEAIEAAASLRPFRSIPALPPPRTMSCRPRLRRRPPLKNPGGTRTRTRHAPRAPTANHAAGRRRGGPSSVLCCGSLARGNWRPAPAPMPGIGISLRYATSDRACSLRAARRTLAPTSAAVAFSASRGGRGRVRTGERDARAVPLRCRHGGSELRLWLRERWGSPRGRVRRARHALRHASVVGLPRLGPRGSGGF